TRPIRAPFVGRRAELDELRLAFEHAVRERRCTFVTVVGPPGIGKSRLAREVIRLLEGEARVVIGRCAAYGEGVAYLPLAEVVAQVAGDGPGTRLRQLLTGVDRGDVAARLIAGALGTGDGFGSPEEIAWSFRRLFETL